MSTSNSKLKKIEKKLRLSKDSILNIYDKLYRVNMEEYSKLNEMDKLNIKNSIVRTYYKLFLFRFLIDIESRLMVFNNISLDKKCELEKISNIIQDIEERFAKTKLQKQKLKFNKQLKKEWGLLLDETFREYSTYLVELEYYRN